VEDVPGKTEMSVARSVIRVVHSPFPSETICERRGFGRVVGSLNLCAGSDARFLLKLSTAGVNGKGVLTRPSACGQAEGCG
jgi:hypothetical protein